MRRRTRQHLIFLGRSLLTGLVLLGYLTASLGIPLPSWQSESPNPKSESKTEASASDARVEVRPCGCAVEADAPCCCCKANSTCGTVAPQTMPAATTTSEMTWLIGELVRQCRGLDRLWASGFLAVPPPAPVHCVMDVPGVALAVLSFSDPLTPSFRPPAPPPRAC